MTGRMVRVTRFLLSVVVAGLIMVIMSSLYGFDGTTTGQPEIAGQGAPAPTVPPGTTPTPLPVPPEPGFSSGSWGGPPDGQKLPNNAYVYGLVGGDGGSYCSGSMNAHLVHAVQTIASNGSGTYYGIFWFLTGVDWAKSNCSYTQSAAQWGIDQANHFLNVLNNQLDPQLTPQQQADLGPLIADVEGSSSVAGATWWYTGNTQGNIATIANFITTLAQGGYLNNAIYTGPGEWPGIVGKYTSKTIPNVGTTQIWMAGYTGDLNTLNSDEQLFTTSPGGFNIFSWQSANDFCDIRVATCDGWAFSNNSPGGAPDSGQGWDCQATFSEAQANAADASPKIPRFDKWTNTEPESECLPPPINF